MYSLRFTPADLDANRQGFLSDDQRTRLKADVALLRQQGRSTVRGFVIFFVFLFGVGSISEYNNAKQDLNQFLSPSNVTGFAVMGSLFISLLVVTTLFNMWILYRLSQGSIHTVEGKAHFVTSMAGRYGATAAYNIEIKRGLFSKMTFRFQDSQSMDYFREGQPYRIYYLPYVTPQALSMESLN